jgi:hypothetical protein
MNNNGERPEPFLVPPIIYFDSEISGYILDAMVKGKVVPDEVVLYGSEWSASTLGQFIPG